MGLVRVPRVRHCPVISRSMVMWQVQGLVRESVFRVQIKWSMAT